MQSNALVLALAVASGLGCGTAAASPADDDFARRCVAPGVVRCIGFDTAADFDIGKGDANGAWGRDAGILPPNGTSDFTRAVRDTKTFASGEGSLRFTIPSNTPADSSGSFFANFSSDLSVQFGENSEFFIQWRQRFSTESLTPRMGGGWKQLIVGTGDTPRRVVGSCSALEVVSTNYHQRGFPVLYHSCKGSKSHGAYDGLYEPFNGYDFKLQNARTAPGCLYSQHRSSYFPPGGSCFGFVANEWMTFQIHVKVGQRVGDEFVGSRIAMWGAREGAPSEALIDWGPYNLSAGPPGDDQRFGKVWLLTYNTGKDAAVAHPPAQIWFDELIVSRRRIADPRR